jgi:hypothetical protein
MVELWPDTETGPCRTTLNGLHIDSGKSTAMSSPAIAGTNTGPALEQHWPGTDLVNRANRSKNINKRA